MPVIDGILPRGRRVRGWALRPIGRAPGVGWGLRVPPQRAGEYLGVRRAVEEPRRSLWRRPTRLHTIGGNTKDSGL